MFSLILKVVVHLKYSSYIALEIYLLIGSLFNLKMAVYLQTFLCKFST